LEEEEDMEHAMELRMFCKQEFQFPEASVCKSCKHLLSHMEDVPFGILGLVFLVFFLFYFVMSLRK
jgi:hypothetical protein